VFGLDRFNSLKYAILGLNLMFSINRISGLFRVQLRQFSLYYILTPVIVEER
jgi:hypothetical protein